MKLSRTGTPPAVTLAALACSAALVTSVASPLSAAAFAVSSTRVGGAPGAVAVDSLTHLVYAADLGSDFVSVYDGSADTPDITRVTVDSHPSALVLDAAGRRVFVASADSGTVSVFDADDPDTAGTAPNVVRVDSPSALAVDPVTHTVYVTSSTENRLYWFDGSAASPVLQSLPVGRQPSGVALDAVAHVVAVTNLGDDTVSLIGTSASDDASVPVVSVKTVAVGASPAAVAIDASTHTAVVANLRDNTVSRFDVMRAVPTVTTLAVGRAPRSVAIDSTTHNAFVANSLGQTVSQFDLRVATPPVLDVPLGKAPRSVGVDESIGTVYASNPLNGTVSGRPPLTPVAPTIVSGEPRTATLGVWYSHIVEAKGTPTPTLSLIGALPAGLHFDAATGQISGTPLATGSTTVTVRAHNLAGPDAVATYTVSAFGKVAW